MSESLFPPIEHFQPEDYSVEQECAQHAFSVVDHFGIESDEVVGNTIVRTIASGRVDALCPSEDGRQMAVRIRTAPMLGFDPFSHKSGSGLYEPHEQDEARIIGAAIVELGSRQDDDFIVDEDFEWSARAAIIVEFADEEAPKDIFICNPNTGEALSQQQTLELLFLVQHIEKNLLGEQLSSLVEMAADYSKVEDVDPMANSDEEIDFILSHACRECGALSCGHNS